MLTDALEGFLKRVIRRGVTYQLAVACQLAATHCPSAIARLLSLVGEQRQLGSSHAHSLVVEAQAAYAVHDRARSSWWAVCRQWRAVQKDDESCCCCAT